MPLTLTLSPQAGRGDAGCAEGANLNVCDGRRPYNTSLLPAGGEKVPAGGRGAVKTGPVKVY
ncbi:hypothetical protein C0075_16540 [Rhizobium sp. KAs_5_22]|nr:hypothetical protein C0075_16540 [Rhizobium sp. KAs_5_22]